MLTDPAILSLLITLAVLLFFLFLLRRALRGRRTGDHPHCARCNYDLRAQLVLSERSESKGIACPECGADLTAPRAVATGSYRRRPVFVTASLLITLLAAACLAVSLYTFPYEFWWRTNAPVSALRWQARLSPAARTWATAVLARRLADGDLDNPTADTVVTDLLALQADPTAPWDRSFAAALSSARWKCLPALTPDRWNQFVAHSIANPQFTTRPRIRQGDPVPVEMNGQDRGFAGQGGFQFLDRLVAAFDRDPEITPQSWSLGAPDAHNSRVFTAKQLDTATLTPGPHKLHLAATWAEAKLDKGEPKELTPRTEFRGTIDVEILPKDTSLGTPVPAPKLASAIAAAMDVGVVRRGKGWSDDGAIFATVRPLPAPADRAFAVYARDDRTGHEYRIGDLLASANQQGSGAGGSTMFHVPIPKPDRDTLTSLTLILRGDGAALANTLTGDKYWPGEITYPTLPLDTHDQFFARINTPKPTTRPFTAVPAS